MIEQLPDTPPPAPTSGGVSARPPQFVKVSAVAIMAANDEWRGGIATVPLEDTHHIQRWPSSMISIPIPANEDAFIQPEALAADDLERITDHFPRATNIDPALYRRLSILCVDMADYGRFTLQVSNRLGVASVLAINETIQQIVKDALRRGGFPPDCLIAATGDGVFLVCPTSDAVKLARTILNEVDLYNAGAATLDDGEIDLGIHVRVGIGSGTLAWSRGAWAGLAFVIATRLMAGTPTGRLSIDELGWLETSASDRIGMVGPVFIKGKRGERFMVFTSRHRVVKGVRGSRGLGGWLRRLLRNRWPRD